MLLLGHCFGFERMMLDCWMFSFLQNSLKVSDVMFTLASETVFLSSPNSANVILAAYTRSCAERLVTFFYNWKHTVIIYNTKKVFITNHKYVSTNYLPGYVWYICVALFHVVVYTNIKET